ncbi:ArsR/SmtB family transcription factor [Tenggerimyces flavus]|uniref:ArsR/SmtB family transcription factor n=1 Tax=Tenggerimyces flavus TaxID=1708749 RepID=A0ABV7YI70_9ACTN|nr:winged helix-turn-helix domain-containing protein [Tenggerimyces flavus]MBM7784726.1 DNA-binding transcriptional ArsR family regulator [Tenggerimyces flavus]
MWRIHLTADDLARVRLATGADPMWELMHSVQVATGTTGELVYGRWRHRCKRMPGPQLDVLSTLAPMVGYAVDFLTPAAGTTSFRDGVDTVLRTPRRAFSRDLTKLAGNGRLPSWTGDLAAGRRPSLHALGRAMVAYFDTALAPYWAAIARQVDEELARTTRLLVSGGVERLLASASRELRWRSPVLLAGQLGEPQDIYLEGQGLMLLPSFFAEDDVTILRLPDHPLVVSYPLDLLPGWCTEQDPRLEPSSLSQLFGPTRARMLEVLSEHGLSTTELAGRLDTSVPTASQQAKVLRDAGLVTSSRQGKAVLHQASDLGRHLLDASRVRV